ncbi:unnamed protein product [Paramecium primaurelia]|uniref:Protein kinase domain-containing protein n=1 Tax=Paramecium primaurelia TaxID=5886 RepID=A0A8S1ND65_PARPR|nr:unnamed protein product [Paramecium primaurelia]
MQSGNNIFVFTQQDFQKCFVVNLNPPLGQGHDARVYLAMHKKTGEMFALKVLTNLSQDHIRNLQVQLQFIQRTKYKFLNAQIMQEQFC